MHPFYIQRATDIEDDPILHAQHIISDSRKIFRLFKSLNHVSKLINSSLVDTHCLKDVVVKILCMIEDALWVRYVLQYDRSTLLPVLVQYIINDCNSNIFNIRSLCFTYSTTSYSFFGES
jgi:hypothetical protein